MTFSRVLLLGLLPATLLGLAAFLPTGVRSQESKEPTAKQRAADAPKNQDQDKDQADSSRPELPTSKLPLELHQGERIAFVGNATAERMNLFGHFETLLHLRFPDKELVVRNFAWPADEVGLRQRPNDYTKLGDPLAAFRPETFLCFFGWNESFAGPDGLKKFESDYDQFLDEYARKYPVDASGGAPRFVLVSPLAFEPTGDKFLPEAEERNANLARYADAVKAVARKRGLAFVDVFTPTLPAFAEEPGMQFTINGVHLDDLGDKLVAGLLDESLFGSPAKPADSPRYERLREAVIDKAWIHQQDYRMLNGWYVYGGRRTWDTETFPREIVKIRNMAAVRDRYAWDIARGNPVTPEPDDSQTGDLYTPPTRFGEPRQKYSEAETLRYLTPDEFIKTCTVPPGFAIELFADEKQFPEIAKPVQLNFDAKGRLWVSTMPTYPQWKPGDEKPDDKIVILEDTDGDGKADKSTIFYDKLHCPVGFEFYNGGVLVVDQPRLIWLKDTDGDDQADVVVHLIDGWATQDTHHTINAFEYSHGGLLNMLEGVSMSTTVETPWGPFRNFGSSGCYVLDPRTLKVRHFNTPGYGNPWCYVYNEWGQGFCGDGTGANQHWDTLLSGAQYGGRKGASPLFPIEGMRPVVGSEFLVSRQFPDDVQGQFIYACVINMNGMPRWTIRDDGAGYKGTRVRHNPDDPKTPYDLIKSTDKHFRPVDPRIGPDGALWFGDWANALIGHMQYSQRDPNRDHQLGRLYRLVYRDKPLLKPVTQDDKTIAELLEQFREPEWRTRQRARQELRDRPASEVLAALKDWAARLDPKDPAYDRLRCEVLWTQQGHHAVDLASLEPVLAAKTFDARAAAVRVLADERDRIDVAFDLLKAAATDEHPRVRTEAVRGLSFYPTVEAAVAVLAALKGTDDPYLRYTAECALGANESAWRRAYLSGDIARGDADARKVLGGILSSSKTGGAAHPFLEILLGKEPQPAEARNKAMQALSDMKGNPSAGRLVFERNCTACHRVGTGDGQDYGPNFDKVATRLSRYKLVESIIDPNAEVDAKFLSTAIATQDGKVTTGLLVSESKDRVVLFDGKEKREINTADIEERTSLKQSSMPEGLAAAMAPVEFLDLVAYLATLK